MKPAAPKALGSVIPFKGDTTSNTPTGFSAGDENFDHFNQKNGIEYAGTHLILDLWDAERLDDLKLMEETMREAVITCGATLLHIHLHHFTPTYGISGVAILAESHISVHTWPERNFAAFDIFMCGDAKPEYAIPILKKAFNPGNMNISEHLRGMSEPLENQ